MKRFLLIAFVAMLSVATAWAATRPTEDEQVGLTIIGRRDLAFIGDTATWCALAFYKDGSKRLGNVALRVRAETDTSVVAVYVPEAITACRPLLRAKGIPEDLPMVEMLWSVSEDRAARGRA